MPRSWPRVRMILLCFRTDYGKCRPSAFDRTIICDCLTGRSNVHMPFICLKDKIRITAASFSKHVAQAIPAFAAFTYLFKQSSKTSSKNFPLQKLPGALTSSGQFCILFIPVYAVRHIRTVIQFDYFGIAHVVHRPKRAHSHSVAYKRYAVHMRVFIGHCAHAFAQRG